MRGRERLVAARKEVAVCAISGAVGTFANVDLWLKFAAQKMGLAVEPVSTQVPRDRHAAYFAALAVVASSIENLAVEIRHLQRTEVLEAEEPFDPGQKGRRPCRIAQLVLTENPTGLAWLVRSRWSSPLRTWPCGTSVISRIPRSSAALLRTPRSISTSPYGAWRR